ncbi:MAG: DUF4131 domain-containing protein, partial [Candidatus Yonathbacteria bacterium]|nr:DUF4131 domain-containing protein [Candidatus Yonathbacteria bacterium]
MHPSRTLTCAMTGLFVGVFLRSFIAVDVWGAIFLVLLATACVAVFLFYNKRESLVTVAIVLVCAGCGIARFDTLARTDAESVVRAGEQISGEAIVVDEPDVREAYTRLVLEPFDTAGRPLYREHILAYAERFPAYRYGDRVRFTGTPTLPEVFASDDTGRTFDYPSYLRKDGIRYQMFRPTVTRIASGQGNPFRAAVLDLKERFSGGLARILPEPESSLAGGLIVGTKQSLGAKLLQEF